MRIAVATPSADPGAALHAVRQALVVLGVGASVVPADCESELVLSPIAGGSGGLSAAGRTRWELVADPRRSDAPGRLPPEVIETIMACLVGARECGMPRDRWGVPITSAGSVRDYKPGQRPVGAWAVEQIERFLSGAWPRWRATAVPPWPGGAAFAVSITHDVDLPYRYPPWKLHLARSAMEFREGAPRRGAAAVLSACRSAAMQLAGFGPASRHDDHFAFGRWRQVEADLSARSAFYISVTPTSSPFATPQDVTYDPTDRALRRAIREAAAAGWEIGLHASIRATRIPGRILVERNILAEIAEVEVHGVRHHFWCLPGDDPWLGWREQHLAGFRYDSSLGLNDVATFRWGWPWPFLPWDPDRGSSVPVLQIPPLVMDAAVARPGSDPVGTISRIREAAAAAIVPRGVLVLDWHLEQFAARRLHGAGPALLEFLHELRSQTDAWWATPAGIADWWLARDRQLWRGPSRSQAAP